MFKNVIVGVDGNEGGRDAIALARVLLADGGELTLAYVYHGDPHVRRGSSPAYDAAERDRARELLEQAREDAGIEAHLRWRGSPSVGRGLHELAEAIGSDLLVIGSSRRGLLGRVLVGDDTRASLNGASCAVAIAPAGYSREAVAMREIGVAYNGTGESEHALSVARKLAAQHGAKLSAFEAVSLPTYAFIGGVGGAAPVAGAIEDRIADARERIAALDGVEPHAAYGVPAEELAMFSASTDLLIVGSRDYGPIGRLVHGSTSRQLARSARCPLLVLTRGARSADMPETSGNGHEASVPASA
jgi:nucleotide-binding universal stress UspA family protein